MASLSGSVEPGQFDDAPEGTLDAQILQREGNAYIDTYDLSGDEDSEDGEADDDFEDYLDDAYDENLVEDEDWEVAEKGAYVLFNTYDAKLN